MESERVLILGSTGAMGWYLTRYLLDMGCQVTVMDINVGVLRDMLSRYDGKIGTMMTIR